MALVKGDLVKSIAELVDEKKIDGIADISDLHRREAKSIS